jgi:hypothetical protein
VSERVRIPVEREVVLRTLARRPLPVRVREVLGGEAGEVRVVLELPAASWTLAQRDGLFGLGPVDRSDRLDAARPVELDAVLRRDVATALEVNEIARALASGDTASPVTVTEVWRALSVVQAVAVPAGVDGSLKSGFRTAFAEGRASGAGAVAPAPASPPIDVVRRVAERHELVLEDLGDGLYRAHTARWPLLIRIGTQQCAVYSVHPRLVPAERRADAAAWMAMENYDLVVGGFEMDLEDGEVRFRTSLDVTGDRLSEALFDRLLVINLAEMAARFDQIG